MPASTRPTRALDLGQNPQLDELYGFYHKSPKSSETGLTFASFAGFYYYLITGSQHRQFLKGDIDEQLIRESNWVYVEDLEPTMYRNFVLHMAKYPLSTDLALSDVDSFIWTREQPLNGAEKRWLNVLNLYLDRRV